MEAIKKACEVCGSQADLARKIGVTAGAVYQWMNDIRPVPLERCIDIERATNGAVTCEELRPDVDWAYLRGTRTKAEAA